MESIKNQKIRQLMDELRTKGSILNDTDFSKKVGANRSQVSEVASGRRPVSQHFILKILSAFPEVNPQFLQDADCTQVFKDGSTVHVPGAPQPAPALQQDSEALRRIIDAQTKQIDRLIGIIEKLQNISL